MEGYDIEQLYYLFIQGCPIAKEYLIYYIYHQSILRLSQVYLVPSRENDVKDNLQIVTMKVYYSLKNYRPDRGMLVKSFISMLIDNTIRASVIKKRVARFKDKYIQYSLDDYYDGSENRYIDSFQSKDDVAKEVIKNDTLVKLKEVINELCSEFEGKVIYYHIRGFDNKEIAAILHVDLRSVYNANYRIYSKVKGLAS